MQTKISNEHYSRKAYIYIRQSSMHQVHTHLESQRLQYKLVERAQEFGWADPVVIDSDLGRSGSGTVFRPGFLQLLTAVEQHSVGAIFCIEASRLARNNREWYQLIEHCAIVKTLLIDLDGIYDPANISDRVYLGMKGTMSEYELGIFRQRAQSAILEKAKRGEYYTNLPAGYMLTIDKHCQMDPNQRIIEAFDLIFKKFRQFGVANEVVLWFREETIEIPCRNRSREVIWKLPTNSLILKILKNPIYAGAYVYGRTRVQYNFVDGQLKKTTEELPIDQWEVLIKNHHEAYISWDEYLANRERLPQNSNKRGLITRGAPKRGPALLSSLLRCQRCAQKLNVRYSGGIPRYFCTGQANSGKTENCISFCGTQIEQLVSKEVLQVVEPAAISAAHQAEELFGQNRNEKEQSLVNMLKQAEYEANRCFEQFNLADPKNRLAAQNLENHWNKALEKVEKINQQLDQSQKEYQPLTVEQRKALYRLAEDLPKTWQNPQADVRLKKRILQTLIKEIIVDIEPDNHLTVSIHWVGAAHTQYRIKRRKKGQRKNYLHPETEKIVSGLAEVVLDQDIARILNLLKIKTASSKTWTAMRVAGFRKRHQIPIFDPVEYEAKGWVNLQQAAEILESYPSTIKRLIKADILKARQVIKYSPWIIEKEQLKQPLVVNAVRTLKNCGNAALTKNQCQLKL